MITKGGATELATAHQNALALRVEQFLRARAAIGAVGGVFRYTEFDVGPKAQEVRQQLLDAGWSVVVDTTARTVTIS